jgi:hypothetical protein
VCRAYRVTRNENEASRSGFLEIFPQYSCTVRITILTGDNVCRTRTPYKYSIEVRRTGIWILNYIALVFR